jgi:DNA helicase-2/ATP-dependent DNA helicase PcrA
VVEPEIILGPPGTGKTTTLLQIVDDELAAGTPPDRIGYVSFTRRAATEAQTRAQEKFGLGRADLPWFRTLHSLCMRCLGLSSSAIMDGDRLQEFSQIVGERITGRFSVADGTYSGYDRGDRMLFMDNLARVRRLSLRVQYEESHDDIDWDVVDKFSRTLLAYKTDQGLVDYTDMLEQFVREDCGPRLDVLLVDEAQDLSIIQWDVVWRLAQHCRRFVVVGDDDQAIFVWAGADVRTLIDLPGRARVLGQSWRVPRAVQRVADDVIGQVSSRRPKEWAPRPEEGHLTMISSLADADWSGDSVLVLARNQYLLRPVMEELESSGVLYEHHGHPSVRQTIMQAIVAWETLRRGDSVTAAEARRAYDLMTVGVGVQRGHKTLRHFEDDARLTLADLRESGGLLTDAIWHVALDKISPVERAYIVRCRRNRERLSRPPRVRVGTVHESKGGEADRVILLTDMAPRTHAEAAERPDDEARVWYVGATRARQELCVVRPRGPRHFTFAE